MHRLENESLISKTAKLVPVKRHFAHFKQNITDFDNLLRLSMSAYVRFYIYAETRNNSVIDHHLLSEFACYFFHLRFLHVCERVCMCVAHNKTEKFPIEKA